jgi:hypothetical protein
MISAKGLEYLSRYLAELRQDETLEGNERIERYNRFREMLDEPDYEPPDPDEAWWLE